MRRIDPSQRHTVIPDNAPVFFFVFRPGADSTRFILNVADKMTDDEHGDAKHAIIWFLKGVSEKDAEDMLIQIGELIGATNPGEPAKVLLDATSNVDPSWVKKARRMYRKHQKRTGVNNASRPKETRRLGRASAKPNN